MKKWALVFVCLVLAGCGFRPLYSNTNTLNGGSSALDMVSIDLIADATGQELRNALIDRFYHNGYPSDAQYDLNITTEESSRDLAIRKDATATRAQLVIRAAYKLKSRATGQIVDAGDIRAVSSYNILSSQYTTLATQGDARSAVIRELADKITLRLAVVLQKE